MAPPDLSLVVPVYNEAQVLERTLEELFAFLAQLSATGRLESWEVVAVDDGSRDGSGERLGEAAAREPRLVVLSHSANRGKGAAVRTGMLAATGARRVFLDADLSTPLEELYPLLDALDAGYQVVLGNRRAPGSEITRHQPWFRELLGKGFTGLTRLLLAPGVDDFTCGFKGFRGDAAERIFSRSTLDGWAFDAELVVIARVQGLSITQIPVHWRNEEDTKVRLLGAVFGSLRDLGLILSRRLAGRYR